MPRSETYPCCIVTPMQGRSKQPTNIMEILEGARQGPQTEDFEFCAECALALILALKQRKANPQSKRL